MIWSPPRVTPTPPQPKCPYCNDTGVIRNTLESGGSYRRCEACK